MMRLAAPNSSMTLVLGGCSGGNDEGAADPVSADQNPTVTLIVTVNSTTDFETAAAIIDGGRPARGHTVEASQVPKRHALTPTVRF